MEESQELRPFAYSSHSVTVPCVSLQNTCKIFNRKPLGLYPSVDVSNEDPIRSS